MMKPLLEMRTVPMSLEFKVNNAKYEIINTKATYELTRNRGGLQMKVNPTKLNIDTVEARYSAGIKSVMRSIEDFAKKGIHAAYEATASYAKEGNLMLDINIMDNPIPELAMKKFFSDVEFNIGFSPKVGPDISWETGGVSMKFEMDKLDFDWNIGGLRVDFIPGSIEVFVKEYPKIEINYVGTPIFVPPSSDPNYKEIDTLA